jgi:hypothetical protein
MAFFSREPLVSTSGLFASAVSQTVRGQADGHSTGGSVTNTTCSLCDMHWRGDTGLGCFDVK